MQYNAWYELQNMEFILLKIEFSSKNPYKDLWLFITVLCPRRKKEEKKGRIFTVATPVIPLSSFNLLVLTLASLKLPQVSTTWQTSLRKRKCNKLIPSARCRLLKSQPFQPCQAGSTDSWGIETECIYDMIKPLPHLLQLKLLIRQSGKQGANLGKSLTSYHYTTTFSKNIKLSNSACEGVCFFNLRALFDLGRNNFESPNYVHKRQ